MESIFLEPDFSLVLYKTIRYTLLSFGQHYLQHLHISTQTITVLDVSHNQMADQGVTLIAIALKKNTVQHRYLFIFVIYIFTFYTETP